MAVKWKKMLRMGHNQCPSPATTIKPLCDLKLWSSWLTSRTMSLTLLLLTLNWKNLFRLMAKVALSIPLVLAPYEVVPPRPFETEFFAWYLREFLLFVQQPTQLVTMRMMTPMGEHPQQLNRRYRLRLLSFQEMMLHPVEVNSWLVKLAPVWWIFFNFPHN